MVRTGTSTTVKLAIACCGVEVAVTPPRKKGVEGSMLTACPEGRGGPGFPGAWLGPNGSMAAVLAAAGAVTVAAAGVDAVAAGAAAGACSMDVFPIVQLINVMETFCPAITDTINRLDILLIH